eukprot:6186074-Pleurochrysis_carterae.AAC.3
MHADEHRTKERVLIGARAADKVLLHRKALRMVNGVVFVGKACYSGANIHQHISLTRIEFQA